jgi:hypothetical protein
MARVNVEQIALTDPRMKHLGKLLGGDHRLAIGHMVYVWNYCQERDTYTLTPAELSHLTDVPDFPGFLLESRLGRKEGRAIYISGARGRVEWLGKARKNGGKGGRPSGSGKKNHTVSKEEPSGYEVNNPPAPAPAPALPPAEEAVCVKGEPAKRKRATPTKLTREWSPDETVLADLRSSYPAVDLDTLLTDFYRYWIEDGTKHADWNRTLRNRVSFCHAKGLYGRRNTTPRSASPTPAEPGNTRSRFGHESIEDLLRDHPELTEADVPVRPN